MKTLILLAFLFSQASRAVETPSRTDTRNPQESGAVQVRVTGHLTGSKDLGRLPVTLYSPSGSSLQTSAAPDGSFEFVSLSSGHYVLRAPGFITLDVAVDGKDLNVDLKPVYSGPGVSVSGKVMLKSPGLHSQTLRTVTLTPQFLGPSVTGGVSAFGGSLGGSLNSTLEAWVRPDGTFEFPAVPAGAYTLRSLPASAGTSRKVEVADREVRNLEIIVPFQLEVTGRVILEGRDLGPNATVQATMPTFTMATGIHNDGSFRLRLTEGTNQISMARLPEQFAVKRIAYGEIDATQEPLNIDTTTTPREMVITLENVGGSFNKTESTVAPGTIVAGSVLVVDAAGMPYPFRPNVSMVFTLSSGALGTTSVRPDGTFSMPLSDNRYMTTVGNLPAEYSIKSISSGSVDLMKNPLVVDEKRVPDNIVVVLQYRPSATR